MATIDDTSGHGDGNVRLPEVGPENKVLVVPTELKAGALSLPEVLMQSVTTIAPAIAALFFTPVVVGLAGLTSPLAYLLLVGFSSSSLLSRMSVGLGILLFGNRWHCWPRFRDEAAYHQSVTSNQPPDNRDDATRKTTQHAWARTS